MSTEQPDLSPSPSILESGFGDDLSSIFTSVAEKIHFEPYPGVLRGPLGTAISGGGNSADQALLLAHLLRIKGYRVRFVRGTLGQGNLAALLRGAYPPEIKPLNVDPSLRPYHPESDPSLAFAGTYHYWVEVDQGDSWLPLDPSFPRAKMGESYGKKSDIFDDLPGEAYQSLTISLMQRAASGQTRTIIEDKMNISETGYQPISLLALKVPQSAPARMGKKRGNPLGAFGGATAGVEKKKEGKRGGGKKAGKKEVAALKYQYGLSIPGKGFIEKAVSVSKKDRRSLIAEEWLQFEIDAPGMAPKRVKRTLFSAQVPKWEVQPEAYRRYQIGIFPGRVPGSLVEEVREKAKKLIGKNGRAEGEKLSKLGDKAPEGEALNLESKSGQVALQMILLRFAESSDEISDRSAYRTGLAVVRGTPRILISSLTRDQDEKGKAKERFSLDLRLDEVTPLPFPGYPSSLSRLYLKGRGMQESRIEGGVLETLTGRESVTTADIFQRVDSSRILVLNRKNFKKDGRFLPKKVATLVEESVKEGKLAVIPGEPVSLKGKNRWGFWELDPETGRTIGVMDDGLHSSMAEYSISSSRINLNDNMGFVIGGITGASSTLFVISAKILEYGQVTDKMIEEVEQFLKSALCFCPKAEASVSGGAGASLSGSAGCFEKELASKSVGGKIGASVSVGSFCDSFVKGFRCASGAILAGLKGESPGGLSVSVEGKAGIGGGVKFSCE